MNRGGKIITPIREAVRYCELDGVKFACKDKKHAEQIRISACIANGRNGFELRTHRVDSDLIVYKPDVDLYGDDGVNLIDVDLTNSSLASETDI